MPSPARRPLFLLAVLTVLLLAATARVPGSGHDAPDDQGAVLAAASTPEPTDQTEPTDRAEATGPAEPTDPTSRPTAPTSLRELLGRPRLRQPEGALAPVRPVGTRPGKKRPKAPGKAPGRPRGKVVHLTFDDGPSDWTPAVLRILTAHDATATFFVLGAQAELRPHLLGRIRRQGSVIGNHTVTHPQLTRLSDKQIRWQLATGPHSRCFRPPYGATDPRVVRIARSLGMRQVLWSADSRDWELPGRRAITDKALLGLRTGAIILMHDGGGDRAQTVAALPGLLEELARRGYRVRALPGCAR